MIAPKNLRKIKCCSSLFILFLFFQTSHANKKNNRRHCIASACGVIRNISFPFRLKDDPKHCGYPEYELACENNVTTVDLNTQKFLVKSINYDNFTIRLADVSVNNYSICSFPLHSVCAYNFSSRLPYSTRGWGGSDVAWPINFISCPYPLTNSSHFMDVADCVKASQSSTSRYSYIKVGHMNASDVRELCRVDMIVMTSWKFKDFNHVQLLSEIHDSLMYGFELSWYDYDLRYGIRAWVVVLINIVEIIIVFVFAVAAIPAKSIIALICFGGFIPSFAQVLHNLPVTLATDFILFLGLLYTAKNIILFPCMIWLLIRKFRRRHMSMYDAIEDFLQSDNKLMPIRYSYSDIKRMTRGFREKLGQGGYGSVYKGKLQSGHYVAVKLLEKTRANGQDFMNEIATIGRIHHVNVVKLVGYCAERSKRALVYDFMPNGSLDKYILSRDNMNSLDWKIKFEIAVGVARGIEYLHRGCDVQILHFDIKPHNILLDEKFVPKISDFGLAKFFSTEKKTVTLTAARGTIGYVAPELINPSIGRVSYKADVYSFGMLLIEMVRLKRDLMQTDENSSQYFPHWIYDSFEQGKNIEYDEDEDASTRGIGKKLTVVALWCIQMYPDGRPSMNKVIEMLEGDAERLLVPRRPSQSTGDAVNAYSYSSSDSVSLLYHDASPSVEIIVED